MFKITDNTNYLSLIKLINAKLTTFDNLALNKVDIKTEKFLCIRHDVDFDLDAALRMSRYENENGLFSIYFLLHTSPYFEYSKKFLKMCKEIVRLGHQIGFHNNVLSEHINTKEDIKSLIERPLTFLRDGGIEVKGTSSHGDILCRKFKFFNNEVWDFVQEKPPFLEFEKQRLSDYDLLYDTRMFYFQAFLGDGSGKWNGSFFSKPPFEIVDNIRRFPSIRKDVIEKFNRLNSGFFHLLIHPRWWKE